MEPLMLDSESPSPGYDAYAHHAFNLIRVDHKDIPPVTMPIPPTQQSLQATKAISIDDSKPIGILGAGPGGLYTALILDDLKIPYEILEAQDHVGGRLFTHTFNDQTGAPYNYFDVGAMRFPKIAAMNRVFKLFNYKPLNKGDDPLKKRLKKFWFEGTNKEKTKNATLMSYNGITMKQCDIVAGADDFKSAEVIRDTVAQVYIKVGAKAIAKDVIAPFADAILKDLGTPDKHDGWNYLKRFDSYSTRSYMTIVYRPSADLLAKGLPDTALSTDVVNWCETFDGGTGWYDRAFSETVLEAIAFGWPDPAKTKWFCLDGGAHQLAKYMANYITERKPKAITFNSRVTAIGLSKDKTSMDVIVNGTFPYQYSHVISTIPLPVLRTVDLRKAELSPLQSNALRELNYGPSVKIGMQFKTAWWTNSADAQGNPLDIVGSQTYTDSPLRTIVYPSFGDVFDGKTTTLIASYCWTEDADRFAGLIGKDEAFPTELVLRELAVIHNATEEFLRRELIGIKAWSWTQDPYTMGAFAFFGPGKFRNLYTSLNRPAASGHLHFAGEALSVRHAWVEGALDSAWRAVYELLLMPGFSEETRRLFVKHWGANPEWIKSSHLRVPTPHKPPHRGIPGAPPSGEPDEGIPQEEEDIFSSKNSYLYDHIAWHDPELVVR